MEEHSAFFFAIWILAGLLEIWNEGTSRSVHSRMINQIWLTLFLFLLTSLFICSNGKRLRLLHLKLHGDIVTPFFSRFFLESYRYPLVNKSARHVRIQGKRKPYSRHEKTHHTKYSLMYMVLLIVHFHKMYRSSSTHPTENHPCSWELHMKEDKLSLWLPRRSGGPNVIWTRKSLSIGKSIYPRRSIGIDNYIKRF